MLLGAAGVPTQLASGQVYPKKGWGRTSATIGVESLGLEVGGEPVCTRPRADGFELTSVTPDTCTAYAALGPDNNVSEDSAIPVSADVIASGKCTLRLVGAEYSGGQGFASELSVELRKVEDLLRFARP
jgi:hypothetical protein